MGEYGKQFDDGSSIFCELLCTCASNFSISNFSKKMLYARFWISVIQI